MVVIAWVVIWLALGVKVAQEVDGLKELSGTVRTTGSAVEEAGRTLESLDALPIVGSRLADPAREIQDAGRSIVRSGRAGRESIEDLSTLLGLSVALIPSVPVLAFYLPERLRRRRERFALSRLLDRAGADPELQRFLADRALRSLPLDELAKLGPAPWRTSQDDLARAELRRHGLL